MLFVAIDLDLLVLTFVFCSVKLAVMFFCLNRGHCSPVSTFHAPVLHPARVDFRSLGLILCLSGEMLWCLVCMCHTYCNCSDCGKHDHFAYPFTETWLFDYLRRGICEHAETLPFLLPIMFQWGFVTCPSKSVSYLSDSGFSQVPVYFPCWGCLFLTSVFCCVLEIRVGTPNFRVILALEAQLCLTPTREW